MKLVVLRDDGLALTVCEHIEQRNLNPLALQGQMTLREIEMVTQGKVEDAVWGRLAEARDLQDGSGLQLRAMVAQLRAALDRAPDAVPQDAETVWLRLLKEVRDLVRAEEMRDAAEAYRETLAKLRKEAP